MTNHRIGGLVVLVLLVSLAGCGQSDRGAEATDDAAPPAGAAPGANTADQPAAAGDGVVDFDEKGVLTSAAMLFGVGGVRQPLDTVRAATSDRAFVTANGVFAFLETPGNFDHLAKAEGTQPLVIKGKLLTRGRLLHIESTEPVVGKFPIDMTKYHAPDGESTTITGVNKCMCGIKIAQMHTSCQLGHLHHLEAQDGKIYHYLQFTDGADATVTMKYHFKPVSVTGRVFPGQFVLVDSIELAQR